MPHSTTSFIHMLTINPLVAEQMGRIDKIIEKEASKGISRFVIDLTPFADIRNNVEDMITLTSVYRSMGWTVEHQEAHGLGPYYYWLRFSIGNP